MIRFLHGWAEEAGTYDRNHNKLSIEDHLDSNLEDGVFGDEMCIPHISILNKNDTLWIEFYLKTRFHSSNSYRHYKW